MKLFKKNQIIIYVIALMLVTAGYLNYTTTNNMNSIMQTSSREEEITEMANIGDAQLVSSNVSDENNLSNNQITDNEDSTNIEDKESNTIKEENKNEEVKENNSNNASASVTTSSNNNSKDDYFTNSKLERNTMYSQMLETYEKVLNSNNSLETQKQSATEEIKKINNLKNSIMICENLIQTKGFNDVVVFVNDNSVSVVVATTELTKENVAQIQNIIARELKVEVDNIHISNK